jgi:hypothetical protein
MFATTRRIIMGVAVLAVLPVAAASAKTTAHPTFQSHKGYTLTCTGPRYSKHHRHCHYVPIAKSGVQGYQVVVPAGTAGAQGLTGTAGPAGPAGSNGSNGSNGSSGTDGAKGDTGPAGLNGSNGSNGVTGTNGKDGRNGRNGRNGRDGKDGATGATGATGPEGPAELESMRFCVPALCIDDAPGALGNNGSGGFGWDNVNNVPVTSVTVGTPATLTVTALDDGTQSAGSITLTWDGDDFAGPTSGSDSSATCVAAGNGDSVHSLACTYSDFSHADKSDSFTFTPLKDNPAAVVEATVQVGTNEAMASFPVKIIG